MIRPTLANTINPSSLTRPDNSGTAQGTRAQRSAAPSVPAAAKPNAEARAASANALGTEAPAGTDPALWSILTGEERQFFAQLGAKGPLTYGHYTRSQSAPPPTTAAIARGGRLDVKA